MKMTVTKMCLVVLGLLAAAAPEAGSQETNKIARLEVRVSYSGSGTVDEKHKVYVVLWDSPAFAEGEGMPVGLEAVVSKNGVATFPDVAKSPAYISTVFDPSGSWDAQSPPPDGSSLGMYHDQSGKPNPIDVSPGKTTTIQLTFDDSIKMQGGRPGR